MKNPTKLSRRDFVQRALGTGVALGAPVGAPLPVLSKPARFLASTFGSLLPLIISGSGHFERANS